MTRAIPILLLLLFIAPLPSSGGDIPFGIDLKELERPKSAVSATREREKTKKERRHVKRTARAGRQGPSPPTVPAPPAATWVCPVPEQDPAATIDSMLALLTIAPERNKTVEAGRETGTAFSIAADRYFEYKGGRYVVSIGGSDPAAYTLLRVLETRGYHVLRLTGREDYRGAAVRLLTAVGVAPDFGRHSLENGTGITGFLIKPEGAGGRRVVVSAERVEPGQKWPLAPGCGAR